MQIICRIAINVMLSKAIFMVYNIAYKLSRRNFDLKKSNVYKLVQSSLMATFVIISTFLGITFPIGATNFTFHLGNIVCLLAGILLGPFYGGLAAAIGSAIFDLLNPLYIASLPFTFVFKFIMTFICGLIAHCNGKKGKFQRYNVAGALIGSLVYVILRSLKAMLFNLYLLQMEPFSALLLTLNGTLFSLVKTIFTVLAVAILLPLIQEKLNKVSNK